MLQTTWSLGQVIFTVAVKEKQGEETLVLNLKHLS
jgi:hypothetical protein